MIKPDSPLRNLPRSIGPEQAFFFDGMRHAAEICELSYKRLTKQLSEASKAAEKDQVPTTYATYYLDAWAFVDSRDKYVGLWTKQPQQSSLPNHFAPELVKEALQPIRQIRNISDHLSSNKNKLLQLNSASFGVLSWIMFFQRNPPRTKTFAIYPGILKGNVKLQFSMPKVINQIINDIGHISLKVGNHIANLTTAYNAIRNLSLFLENKLPENLGKTPLKEKEVYPCDLLARSAVYMQRNVQGLNKGLNSDANTDDTA